MSHRFRTWLGNRFLKISTRAAKGSNPEEWLEGLKEASDRIIAESGPASQNAMVARYVVATQLEEMGRNSEAQALWDAEVRLLRERVGPDDLLTVKAEEYLAMNLLNSGETNRARDMFMHIHDVRLELLGPSDEATQWVRAVIDGIGQDDSPKSEP